VSRELKIFKLAINLAKENSQGHKLPIGPRTFNPPRGPKIGHVSIRDEYFTAGLNDASLSFQVVY
jgi:hypothetical protein